MAKEKRGTVRTRGFTLLFLLATAFLFAVLGVGQTVLHQTKYAGSATTPDPQWVEPSKATGAPDNQCATVAAAYKQLYLTNFGFQIPDGAAIQGIKVRVKAGRAAGRTFTTWLRYDGWESSPRTWVCVGVYSCVGTGFSELGGPTDLWGRSWSASEVNSSNFGVRICSCEGEGTRYVDAVEITVYYVIQEQQPSLVAPGPWSAAVPRTSSVESGALNVYYYNASSGSSVTVAVQSVLPQAPSGFKLWIKGPAQTGYVELVLTDPNQAVAVATGISGSGSFSVYLKADASNVGRGDLDRVFVITLVYTLTGGG